MNSNLPHPDGPQIMHPWLPYGAAMAGILVSVLFWYYLPVHFFDPVIHAWLLLILGISISLLAGFAVRLIQLTHQRKKSIEIISHIIIGNRFCFNPQIMIDPIITSQWDDD